MKKKDIVVGQKYTSSCYPGVSYLGIGLSQDSGRKPYRDKNLVVLTGEFAGRIVHENDKNIWLWTSFKKAS